jgi:hypothetical protein
MSEPNWDRTLLPAEAADARCLIVIGLPPEAFSLTTRTILPGWHPEAFSPLTDTAEEDVSRTMSHVATDRALASDARFVVTEAVTTSSAPPG